MSGPDSVIETSYVDARGVRRTLSPESRAAVLSSLGARSQPGHEPVRLLRRSGETVDPPAELVLEDGTPLGHVTRIPAGLPNGYHRLLREGREQMLLVAPRAAHAPGIAGWGWAVQLYAARSADSWGIGDLADLSILARWASGQGATALQLNPLNAPNPGPDPEPSPYYPSTRRFRDPIYLAIEQVPGADRLGAELGALATAGRALNQDRRIDRSRVLALKRAALETIWRARPSRAADSGLDAFRAEQGPALRRWATFSVLSDQHGPGWRDWAPALRDPGSQAVAKEANAEPDRIEFHEWLQWQLDRQFAAAADAAPTVRLVVDLPVGFDPGGFDAWDWQAELADAAWLGSPPDRFNPIGQDWGLLPFVPDRLREAAYRPFIDTVRAAMRHAGGLRIDHALGLFRSWWVPKGMPASAGAYVRYPADEMLAILAIESERAGAIVIGEDLGTVPAGIRARLAGRGILSTRLLYFEPSLRRVPHLALATVTTHDLPTIAGAWTGSDTAELARSGISHDAGSEQNFRRKLAALPGLTPDALVGTAILAAHAELAASPAALVTATLEDAQQVPERPNVPATGPPTRSNWSLALPRSIESMRADPFVERLARTIAAERLRRS